MLFHRLEYGIFFVVVFLAYWALARTNLLRVVMLLLASWFFFACANPWFLILLLVTTTTDYLAGRGIARAPAGSRRRTLWLLFTLVVNLGLLFVFKYANFFYSSAVTAANLLGWGLSFEPLGILLPAGISFYTFQSISYSIDVYRGRLAVERNFVRYALFVAFFPQLIAGPIVRAVDLLPQIPRRPFLAAEQVGRGLFLIATGLLKKVVVADFLAINLVDRVFEVPGFYSSLEMLLGLYGYTMQVYMDFSAYSDIAIGSALLLGFRLPENFNRPYLATSIADFWRRWHITLSSWLREYLYFPLGGSRGTSLQTYRNLFITFVLIGLWHGADWTFVVYGCLHAVGMCVDRYVRVTVRKRQKVALTAWGRTWRVLLTLHFVVLARIFFRCQSFGQVREVVAVLLAGTTSLLAMNASLWVVLLGSYLIHWTPRRMVEASMEQFARLPGVVQGTAFAMAALLIAQRASSKAIPFVYFNF
jgi:D-alanyl-lipoteichoic acid acyltransferase DltB (MBOAT superfamily)